MTRDARDRFADILTAVDRCLVYRSRLDDGDPQIASMAFDAILRNLAVIGEAVRALPEETRSNMSEIPWASIAGLRNVVVHEYFRVEPDLIRDVVDRELVRLAQAVRGGSE